MSCHTCQKAKGFVQTMGGWVGAGMPIASLELVNTRITLCQSCEHFNGQFCAKCGCYMKAKARMTTAKCPVGKW